jgi:cytoskeletal protein RodZ
VVTNLVYLFLLLGGDDGFDSKFGILGALVTWAEQAYAYVGIIEHAAANAGNKRNNKELAGGSSLDLLAVTLVVQFASVLHSASWLWVSLVGVPIGGAYSLYKAVYGGESNSSSASAPSVSSKSRNTTNEEDENDPKAEKRRRRAEKRRQKWG